MSFDRLNEYTNIVKYFASNKRVLHAFPTFLQTSRRGALDTVFRASRTAIRVNNPIGEATIYASRAILSMRDRTVRAISTRSAIRISILKRARCLETSATIFLPFSHWCVKSFGKTSRSIKLRSCKNKVEQVWKRSSEFLRYLDPLIFTFCAFTFSSYRMGQKFLSLFHLWTLWRSTFDRRDF